ELAMLEAKGRVRLGMPCERWVERALATPGLTLASLTTEIAIESTRLPGAFHGDPADRIIVATARELDARLLTRNRRIVAYARKGHVTVL
ncbi:MAG TPA: type II toxin-antitoxin system VapC family toxin, partial [Candidatus Sulfopaludibacter sp.]|nr:type II toxin-antitoxin system VapC family toxin [Candidatus Sulfopaludibacter sp.]